MIIIEKKYFLPLLLTLWYVPATPSEPLTAEQLIIQSGALATQFKDEHEEIQKFVCSVCSHRCQTLYALTEHENTHSKNRPRNFGCGQCDKTFYRKSTLTEHEGIHGKNRPRNFGCHRCDKAFFQQSTLTKHMQTTHNGQKSPGRHPSLRPRQSPHRRKSSSSKLHYRRDLYLAHDSNFDYADHILHCPNSNQQYKCGLCGRPYQYESSLIEHLEMLTHKFSCLNCNAQFGWQSELTQHSLDCNGQPVQKTPVVNSTHTPEPVCVQHSTLVGGRRLRHRGSLRAAHLRVDSLPPSAHAAAKFKDRKIRKKKEPRTITLPHNRATLASSHMDSPLIIESTPAPTLSPHIQIIAARELLRQDHEARPFACNQCDQRFTNSFLRSTHKQSHQANHDQIDSFFL